jgi:nucleoside-diphosphate kinase
MSGPIVVLELVKENAIKDFRTLIGATNPAQAHPASLRYRFARSIDHNGIHGSDSPEAAGRERAFFFDQ